MKRRLDACLQNYFRDYDPKTGRYLQSDPIGLEGGINTYSYALNQPTRYSDPRGLFVPLVIPGICAAGGCEALLAGGAILMSTPGKTAIKSIAQKIQVCAHPRTKIPVMSSKNWRKLPAVNTLVTGRMEN